MPRLRSATLIAVFVVASFVLPGVPSISAERTTAAAPPLSVQRSDKIEQLRQQAEKAREELAKATKTWEDRKKKVDASDLKLKVTLAELGKADAELNKIREPLAQLAGASYQRPEGLDSSQMLGNENPDDALRAAADAGHVAADKKALIQRASQLRKQREQLASTVQSLQSGTAVEQAKVSSEVERLKKRSGELTRALTAALSKLKSDDARRLISQCDKAKASRARKFPNGLVPKSFLCLLPQKGETLRSDAALTFYKLNAAYKKRFGRDMCITDSYRNLAEQQRLYSERPGMAAVPGKSNHGFGTALDLCGGVQSSGSAQFRWLEANSKKYQWLHPAWAYSGPFEPWHWEYDAKDNNFRG